VCYCVFILELYKMYIIRLVVISMMKNFSEIKIIDWN